MQRSLRQSRVLFHSKPIPAPTTPCIVQRPFHVRNLTSRHRISPCATQHVSHFHQYACRRQEAATAAVEAEVEEQMAGSRPPSDEVIKKQTNTGPMTRFEELRERGLVNKRIVDTLTRTMGLSTMTEVQSKTVSEALTGVDVLAQAKTGTGKTIGFLLPVLQNIISNEPGLAHKKDHSGTRTYATKGGAGAGDVRSIIISPTRELAEQIAEEARKLVQGTGVIIQTAVGGTQKAKHLWEMQKQGCHILVGTPGRLKDILSDPQSNVRAPKLSAFVLDEADRLMDAGFWPEIQEIQSYLPRKEEQDRQTLMFSATVPQEVVSLVRKVMKPNLHYVKTVQNNEEPTHERVKQSLVHVPGFENQIPAVLELCNREIMAHKRGERTRPFKAIVYFNATAETTLAAELMYGLRLRGTQNGPSDASERPGGHDTSILGDKTRVYSIHSRLTQRARTAAAEYFRQSESAILCSSDVTARGMDFPNVTHVIQVGLPPARDSYIHRLGRTARAGREGEGWLIIPSLAKREIGHRLGKLPLQPDTSLTTAHVDLSPSDDGAEPKISPEASAYFDAVSLVAQRVEPKSFENTYMALLGTHQWLGDKSVLIAHMNRLARVQWGMAKPPAINSRLAAKLGLSRVEGLNRAPNLVHDSRGPREIRDYGSRGPSDRSMSFDKGPVRERRVYDRDDGGDGRGRGGFDRDQQRGGGGGGYGRDPEDNRRPGSRYGRGSGSERPTPPWEGRGNVKARLAKLAQERREGRF